MTLPRIATLAFAAALAGLPASGEGLRVIVDLSEQLMLVRRDGMGLAAWPVSTARSGKATPVGEFRPYLLKQMHYSSLYDNAPMPHSIFFSGDYAIHGTTATTRLGSPASAGCIRLHPDDARTLFDLVRAAGTEATLIEIHE